MKKLVIFDFDGVLVDTLGICFSINKKMDDNLSLEEYKSFFDGNFFKAKRKDGTSRKSNPDSKNEYDLKSRKIAIPEILKLMVRKLSEDYILTIVSSTHTESIKKILDRERILDFFKEIFGRDIGKDKVVKIQSILTKYNILPQDAVYVTDTLGDIKEAEKCGVKSVAVVWGFQEKEILEKGNPVAIIDDPNELLPTIQNACPV